MLSPNPECPETHVLVTASSSGEDPDGSWPVVKDEAQGALRVRGGGFGD